MLTTALLLQGVKAAIAAGEAVLEVYNAEFTVHCKPDQSPLTEADQRSHAIITKHLRPSHIPLLSEEGRHIDYAERKRWESFWLIDPLDGTKEFIKRNDEFTVNIALVTRHKPLLGIIYVPVKEMLFIGIKPIGAVKLDKAAAQRLIQTDAINAPLTDVIAQVATDQRLHVKPYQSGPFKIVGSRSHPSPELQAYVDDQHRSHGAVEFKPAGSSLKFCLVAEAQAHVYPRLGPTMEWDTAAGQAIAESAGAQVLEFESRRPLTYNKPDLLNPWFIVLT